MLENPHARNNHPFRPVDGGLNFLPKVPTVPNFGPLSEPPRKLIINADGQDPPLRIDSADLRGWRGICIFNEALREF